MVQVRPFFVVAPNPWCGLFVFFWPPLCVPGRMGRDALFVLRTRLLSRSLGPLSDAHFSLFGRRPGDLLARTFSHAGSWATWMAGRFESPQILCFLLPPLFFRSASRPHFSFFLSAICSLCRRIGRKLSSSSSPLCLCETRSLGLPTRLPVPPIFPQFLKTQNFDRCSSFAPPFGSIATIFPTETGQHPFALAPFGTGPMGCFSSPHFWVPAIFETPLRSAQGQAPWSRLVFLAPFPAARRPGCRPPGFWGNAWPGGFFFLAPNPFSVSAIRRPVEEALQLGRVPVFSC